MKAYFLTEINRPLELKNATLLKSENEIITKVKMAGINRRDNWIIKGLYPGIALPAVLGSDAIVDYNGEEYIINPNENWGPNKRVPSKEYNIRGLEKSGTFAEYTAVSKDKLFKKPPHLSIAEAAVLPLAGMTAYRALISNCQVKKGDKVFVNGIGGGVALMAMQFALAIGAEVYVSSSSDKKIAKAIKLGATSGINYSSENWGKEFKKKVGGMDVIIDSAGGEGFSQLINLANMGCRIGVYGGTRGIINGLKPQHLFFKQIHIFGSTMANDQEFADMVEFVANNKIKPIVDQIFPYQELNNAMEHMLSKARFGKIAIQID